MMQRSIIKRVIMVFSVALMFTACEYAYITPEVIEAKRDFKEDIVPIFENRGCSSVECHKPLGSLAPDFSSENLYESILGYVDTISPEQSALYLALTTGSTHQGMTSSDMQNDILQWIAQGAKDKVVIIPKSFANDIIPIFNQKCNMAGCHVEGHSAVDLSPANAYASINAKGLIDLAAPENSGLYTKIHQSGTHDGRSTAVQQALILQWITEGALDN